MSMSEEAGVKVDVREVSSVQRELRFEIPWETVQSKMEVRYGEIRRQARPIRGFRKGKAPRWLLEQMFGPQVQAEVSQQLITDELAKVLIEGQYAPVATPEIEPEELRQGQPLAFVARIEVRPAVEDLRIEGLEIKRPVQEVTDAEVDQEVEKLREEAASLRSPEPARPAQKGDVLVVDYQVRKGEKEEPERSQEDQEVELGKGMLQDKVEQALLGANAGDIKVVPLELPAPPEGKEQEELFFHITIKDIREKVLPAVDDAFAKDVTGEHETLLALRLALRETLEKKAEAVVKNALKEQVLEALADANPIDVPPSLVEQQSQDVQAELARMLQMDLDKEPLGEEQTARIRKESERKVRIAFLLTAVAEQAHIEVTDDDVEQRLQEIAEATRQPLPKVKAQLSKQPEQQEQLRISLLEQRVVDHLLDKACIIDVPAGQGDEDAPAEAADAAQETQTEESAPAE
jgi:trigger factor